MEITTSDRIFNNYIDYFNGLEPDWKSNPSKLLKVLLESNSIKAIKFLMNNAEKINEIFPSAEVYSEDIIKELSEYIGYNNRIDLIDCGLKLDKFYLIIGAIAGNQYDMFLYAFNGDNSISSRRNIMNFLDIATVNGNIKVLKYLMNFYNDDFIKNFNNMLEVAIDYNRTEVLDLFVQKNLIKLDVLMNMCQTNNCNNINLKNYISGVTLLDRKRKEEIEIEKEARKLRIV